jgi:alpha-tubulin suppressor-like RCC1 family protein
VSLDVPALELEGGAHSYCAVTGTDRDHLCWGERGFTIRTAEPTDRFVPMAEAEFDGVTLADAQSHACWIDASGGVTCIGANGRGQLGNGSRMASVLPVVATLEADGSPITGALEIEAGTYGGNSCVRTATEVLCWGTNDAGQLGDGIDDHLEVENDCGDAVSASDCTLRAVVATIDGAEVVDLGIGFDHTCALMSDGTVMCWGGNALGQLGLDSNEPVFVPTLVPGVTDVAQLSVAGYNTCVRLTDGRVQCWGQSNVGQVGDGLEVHDSTSCSNDGTAVDCQLTPVFVMGLDDATELGTGFSHSCAVRETNEIVCWGQNGRFQLGDDDRSPGYAPRTVAGL